MAVLGGSLVFEEFMRSLEPYLERLFQEYWIDITGWLYPTPGWQLRSEASYRQVDFYPTPLLLEALFQRPGERELEEAFLKVSLPTQLWRVRSFPSRMERD